MINHRDAARILEQAWSQAEKLQGQRFNAKNVDVHGSEASNSEFLPGPRLRAGIDDVMATAPGAKSFKYLLLTGILARAVDPTAHARAIRPSSKLSGAYDAAALCRDVVVEFEKTKGNLFGLLKNPFANAALRYPEHDKLNPVTRNRSASIRLHEALELVNTAPPNEVYAALVYVLRIAKAESDSAPIMDVRAPTLQKALSFLQRFLALPGGGARVAAVWGALQQLANERADVRVYNPNLSDEYSSTIGDVEIFVGDMLLSAAKCKHQPLSLGDVERALTRNTRRIEYTFVAASGFVGGEERAVRRRIAEAAAVADVTLVDTHRDFPVLLTLLGPRRTRLGPVVVSMLKKMREFGCASEAAALWNQ